MTRSMTHRTDTAFHEAGHLVVAKALGVEVEEAEVGRGPTSAEYGLLRGAEENAVVTVAGPLAAFLFAGAHSPDDPEWRGASEEVVQLAGEILKEHMTTVALLAGGLLAAGRRGLSGRQVARLLRAGFKLDGQSRPRLEAGRERRSRRSSESASS